MLELRREFWGQRVLRAAATGPWAQGGWHDRREWLWPIADWVPPRRLWRELDGGVEDGCGCALPRGARAWWPGMARVVVGVCSLKVGGPWAHAGLAYEVRRLWADSCMAGGGSTSRWLSSKDLTAVEVVIEHCLVSSLDINFSAGAIFLYASCSERAAGRLIVWGTTHLNECIQWIFETHVLI